MYSSKPGFTRTARAQFSTSLRWWNTYQDNVVIFDVNIFRRPDKNFWQHPTLQQF